MAEPDLAGWQIGPGMRIARKREIWPLSQPRSGASVRQDAHFFTL